MGLFYLFKSFFNPNSNCLDFYSGINSFWIGRYLFTGSGLFRT